VRELNPRLARLLCGPEPQLTMMPSQLHPVQNKMRCLYRICPDEISGQRTLVNSAGKMLNNATTPFGVEAGTRSSAAERMIT